MTTPTADPEAGTIPVVFYASSQEVAEYRAHINPAEYRQWCEEQHYDEDSLETLSSYIIEMGSYDYIRLTDVSGTEVRDFEDAEILTALLGYTGPQPLDRDELVKIAKDEVGFRGCRPRPAEDLQRAYGLTEEDAQAVRSMIAAAEIRI